LFKILDKKNPAKLARTMEIMVALLRGRQYALPNDVMTYLKTYDGLIYKMERTDASTIPTEYADALSPELQRLGRAFEDHSDPEYDVMKDYGVFFTWTTIFIKLIKVANLERQQDDNIANNKATLKGHTVELRKQESFLADLKEIYNYEQREKELKGIEGLLKMVSREKASREDFIQTLQNTYKSYEDTFFKDINMFKHKSVISKSRVPV
jgi:hypothetical protein